MPPVRCLVTVPHLKAARSFKLEDGSVNSLKHAVATCPVLGNSIKLSSVRFQMLDLVFEEYTDLAADDEIHDMAKITLLPIVTVPEGGPGSSSTQEEASLETVRTENCETAQRESLPDETSPDDSSPDVPLVGIEPFELPSCSDDDGNTFIFPKLGALHDTIISGKPLTSSSFRKIVELLFRAMVNITVFPSQHFYSKVTQLLTDKYPQLQDVIGTGSDSWRVALRYKFKNERRRLSDDVRVAENRAKFGSKRPNDGGAATQLKRQKKIKLNITASALAGEDEASLIAHEEWLIREGRKAAPDEKGIHERMTLTARKRLSDMAQMGIDAVRTRYPYLMDSQRFAKDFERLTKMNLANKVAKGIDKIVLLATKKAIDCQEHVLLTLQAAPHMDLGRLRTRHILTVATLRILALNVKESTSLPLMFVQEDDENIPPTPCVLYSGQDLEDADFFHLVVDRERLFSVPNAEEGLCMLLAAYWLFSIQYERKAFNMLVTLERLFLGMSHTTPRAVVIKFLNKVCRHVHG
ncbi:sterile alpha motif domain-containing protein 3-like [Ixodes scapularis]|uniref:sterile alpha motif domain-containing protein 3-like n=1 Tax=Ixodes scapularis TaxID=6945 RepID=UPI001AD64D58|nr:sterile alpha motif domain-containing protein 3-like [Ixodes scapularis]